MPSRRPSQPLTLSDKAKSAPQGHSRFQLLRNHWDFLAVVLLIVASLPVIWLSPKTIMVVPHPGLFDDHWDLDAVYRAAHGSWFGRDVAFPYGPIFEWLFSAPARWANLSFTAIYASYNTLLLWCTFLFGYGTLRLLLPEQPNWKRFLLLILLCVFWAPWDGRTAFDIFLFALFLRGWYATRENRVTPLLLGSIAAGLCAIAFLYSADTGVYGIAAFGLAFLGVAWESGRDREALKSYVTTLVIFAAACGVMVFVINLLMGGLTNFQFWRSSLALVSVHRWNEPSAMASEEAVRLLGPLVAGAIIFLLRWLARGDRPTTIAARPGFLLSAFVFAVLAMQSGLIRSDPMHVVFAVFCMVFFSGVVLFSFPGRVASGATALVALAASLFAGLPTTMFRPSSLHYRLAQFRHPSTDCPAGFSDFHDVCYPSGFTVLLDAGDRYLNQHSGPGDSILIFPYQYMFGITSGHNVAGGVLQSFLAAGPYLSHLDITGMQNASAPTGLYFPDGRLSFPIDDVSNFTRTPEIWLWMQKHYRAGPQIDPAVVSLQWDDSRASKMSMQATPLGVAAQTYPIEQADAVVNLGAPSWPADADFLRLRLNVRYGILWKLRKPEQMQLEIIHADGTRALRTFVIEPNVSSDVWFYPWDEHNLASYFDTDQSRWRMPSRSPVTELRLRLRPFDWVSQKPKSVTLDAADAITLHMAP